MRWQQYRNTGDTGICQILRHRLRRRFPCDRRACTGRVARRGADRLSRRSHGPSPDSDRRAAARSGVVLSHRPGELVRRAFEYHLIGAAAMEMWRQARLAINRTRSTVSLGSNRSIPRIECRGPLQSLCQTKKRLQWFYFISLVPMVRGWMRFKRRRGTSTFENSRNIESGGRANSTRRSQSSFGS